MLDLFLLSAGVEPKGKGMTELKAHSARVENQNCASPILVKLLPMGFSHNVKIDATFLEQGRAVCF